MLHSLRYHNICVALQLLPDIWVEETHIILSGFGRVNRLDQFTPSLQLVKILVCYGPSLIRCCAGLFNNYVLELFWLLLV